MFQKILSSLYSWVAMVAVVLLVITANSFYVVHTLEELASLEARIFTTNRVINSLNTLHVAVLRAESGQRGYLLTQEEEYLANYTETLNQINGLIDQVEISGLASDLPGQVSRIENLLRLAKAKLNTIIRVVELTREGNLKEARELQGSDRGLVLYEEFENLFDIIDKSERSMQGEHLESLMTLRSDSVNTLIISAASTAFLIIAIFVLLKMNVRESLRHQQTLEDSNARLESKIEERTQELKVYSDELARSNRELEDFAFVASHDLQEPLRKIRAFGNRLDSGYSDVIDERGQDFLKRMLNAAERMSMLISDLLAFSRVSTRGKEFSEVNLDEVFAQVLSDLEIAIEEADASVSVDPLPTIQADKSQFEQLTLNLLSNALKFRKPDTKPIITVTCEDASEADVHGLLHAEQYQWKKITISDNGIGFEQSFAEKIFAPFQRLHGRSAYKGTGIGLAVCRRIVERHNGTIAADSVPGEGAIFTIIIPIDGEPFATNNSEGVVSND
ncbi:CHASE3 domain-containing protein [Alteromonas sp. ASW11-19]|uniref:histidine kinase n=1 Tax=Alteromonas salexigens TaxID=2982530 RepID=A0ABT2VRB9_9ALTE|nr:sensor histidine kinase [Alteromonas salexigens]MCU7555852.1 CHASE3 domain-containing protein [Alteromonas salexigens]